MKRIFLTVVIGAGLLVPTAQIWSGAAAARPSENYPLVCRGSESLVIGFASGERNIGFAFTRGTKPASEGLKPGQCSWKDRGMHVAEPDRLSQHVPDGSNSLKPGGTLAPENRWYEELHSSAKYWTFMVSNDGSGQLIAYGAQPTEVISPSPTARVPPDIDVIRPITVTPAPGPSAPLAITTGEIQALDRKLNEFVRQLPTDEQAAMGLLLRRAARAPQDDPSGISIRVSFFRATLPGGSPNRQGIVVQGGRTSQESPTGSPGGLPPNPANPVSAALGGDTDPLAIGPKHEDPATPRPDTLATIGPKHEDPMPAPDTINSLTGHLKDFSQQLSPAERGIMDWLLQRAGSKDVREAARGTGSTIGTPGGRPPRVGGTTEVREAASEPGPPVGSPGGLPPLVQALGASQRGDVNGRWVLRF